MLISEKEKEPSGIKALYFFIYRIGKKVFRGKGLRHAPILGTTYEFLSRSLRPELVKVNGYRLYTDPVDGIDFSGASIDGEIKALVSLLEPILLLTMWLIVAIITPSIILPICQLTSSF